MHDGIATVAMYKEISGSYSYNYGFTNACSCVGRLGNHAVYIHKLCSVAIVYIALATYVSIIWK